MGRNAPPLLLSNSVIKDIAGKKNCTPAQVVLSWNMKRGVAVIPKSSHVYRQKENFEAQGKCILTNEDDAAIKGIEAKYVGRFNNPCAQMEGGMPCFEGLQDPKGKGGVNVKEITEAEDD